MVFMEVYGVSQLEGRMLLEFCLEEEFDGVHGGLRGKSVRRKNVTRVLPGGRIVLGSRDSLKLKEEGDT